MSALGPFHTEVSRWFTDRFAAPTDVQTQSWPRIADGEHLVITAPTGSGKTLTAFLWAINSFVSGVYEPRATRVLYISPLKALNNDIRRNLLDPVSELRDRFAARGETFPPLSIRTRSGDTDQSERQRMLRRPPELLITTPESLMLLLTTAKGRVALSTIETVILDEVHSIVESRRGVQLMASLERLVELTGEFQRIALSATVSPLEKVATFVGGSSADGPRPVGIVRAKTDKATDFRIVFPAEARDAADNGQKIWDAFAPSFRAIADANRSTLFFANSRRMAERVTLKINEDLVSPEAYAHHGSLSREIRSEVETRLKAGELKAIVATNSLEMGIDIGSLDEVVLIQSPPTLASAIQRIGRAGHAVGETSRATLFPTHAYDFVEAAVVAKAIKAGDIEPLRPSGPALDVLAQIIVSAVATESWDVDRLYAVIQRAAPYQALERDHFQLVIEMLAGRYAGTRIRDLKPRIAYDRIDNRITARKGAVFALYNSGGTIPDRGYFTLRHADSGAAIGELDEEFVWEATVGQTFTLGTQSWLIHRITHNDVLVKNAPPKSRNLPFWRADNVSRSFYFSSRIAEFLEHANERLATKARDELGRELDQLGFEPIAADELVDFLERQREASDTDLPHKNHLLLEHIQTGPGGYSGPDREQQFVLHTNWGGQVNQPIALALESAWKAHYRSEPDIHADNNVIVAQLKEEIEPEAFLALVTPANFENHLRNRLESSGFFGARFRECAGRALLLTKKRFNQRMPLWMTRMQAKKLMTATKPLDDFPVMLETWRTCLNESFDIPSALEVLDALHSGTLPWTLSTQSTPSPFAAHVTFNQVNRYMYADDSPEQAGTSALSDDLIRAAVFDRNLRPTIESTVIAEFEAKVQRRREGYEPDGELELAEWVKERVAIPADEWFDGVPVPPRVETRQIGTRTVLVHQEIDLTDEPLQKVAEILQFYGPKTFDEAIALLPVDNARALIDELVAAEEIVVDTLVAESDERYLCDRDNLETLIRFQRAQNRVAIEPRAADDLAPFLATWQRFGSASSPTVVADIAERLQGYTAPVDLWVADLWEPRAAGFSIDDLEAAAIEEGVRWRGTGVDQITPSFDGDIFATDADVHPITERFADPKAHYTFLDLHDSSDQPIEEFSEAFWGAVWSGQVAADSFRPLFAAHQRSYRIEAPRTGRQAGSRRARAAARAKLASIGWAGTWRRVPTEPLRAGEIDALERAKDNARLLLDRYGLIARELANREGGELRWAKIFRALRIMELAGEVMAGLFFEGLSGPQFISAQALRTLEHLDRRQATFWINALDPVSPCALGLAGTLPQRRSSNYLGYFEGRLAAVVENGGQRITLHLDPLDENLDGILPFVNRLAARRGRLNMATINGEPARSSPYLPAFKRHLTAHSDHRGIYFEPRVVVNEDAAETRANALG